MFNIFKKRTNSTREPIDGFQESFSKEQKAAIIATLVLIAKSDGHVHPKEMQYIEQTGKLLGIELDDPIHATFASGGAEYLIRILNSMDRSKKEWYVITIQGMITSDGKIDDNEIRFALGFCEDIGISEDEYTQIIKKAEMLMKKFM